jgi:hypothetical protein
VPRSSRRWRPPPAAIWCLAGTALEPVWANARARALGTGPHDLVAVAGRRVNELAGSVARTGRAETVHGDPDPTGQAASVVLQPLEVQGQPGVLVVVEAEWTGSGPAAAAVAAEDVVDQVQHSLLPPALPLLPRRAACPAATTAPAPCTPRRRLVRRRPARPRPAGAVVGDAVGHGVPAAGR